MRSFALASSVVAAAAAFALLGVTVYAHGSKQNAATTATQKAVELRPDETVRLVFERAIPNIPGKRLIAVEVSYPPGGKSAPHLHTRSAFIYAHVLSGAIRSQVNDEPVRVYKVGEGFYEEPGSHHRVSENASASEPASLLAVFITDPTDKLTLPE